MIPNYLKGCPRKRDSSISFPMAELRLLTGNSRDAEFSVTPVHICFHDTLLGCKTGMPERHRAHEAAGRTQHSNVEEEPWQSISNTQSFQRYT